MSDKDATKFTEQDKAAAIETLRGLDPAEAALNDRLLKKARQSILSGMMQGVVEPALEWVKGKEPMSDEQYEKLRASIELADAKQLANAQQMAAQQMGAVVQAPALPPPVHGFRPGPQYAPQGPGAYHPMATYQQPDPYQYADVRYGSQVYSDSAGAGAF